MTSADGGVETYVGLAKNFQLKHMSIETLLERGACWQRPKSDMAFFGKKCACVQPNHKKMQTVTAGKIYNCTETELGIANFKTGNFCTLSTLAVRTN